MSMSAASTARVVLFDAVFWFCRTHLTRSPQRSGPDKSTYEEMRVNARRASCLPRCISQQLKWVARK